MCTRSNVIIVQFKLPVGEIWAYQPLEAPIGHNSSGLQVAEVYSASVCRKLLALLLLRASFDCLCTSSQHASRQIL